MTEQSQECQQQTAVKKPTAGVVAETRGRVSKFRLDLGSDDAFFSTVKQFKPELDDIELLPAGASSAAGGSGPGSRSTTRKGGNKLANTEGGSGKKTTTKIPRLLDCHMLVLNANFQTNTRAQITSVHLGGAVAGWKQLLDSSECKQATLLFRDVVEKGLSEQEVRENREYGDLRGVGLGKIPEKQQSTERTTRGQNYIKLQFCRY